MKTSTLSRKPTCVLVTMLMLLSLGLTAAQAGAGRTRPGGTTSSSSSGSAGRAPTRAAGRASYGYAGSAHHGGYYYPGGSYYGHGSWYGWSGYHYGPYYPYSWWHWGWATMPYYVVQSASAMSEDAPGAIETAINPKKASVVVDGEWLGQARDYNGRFGPLWLEPGTYRVEFSRDGYMTLRRTIRVQPGMLARVEERLQKGTGDDPRSDAEIAAASIEADPVATAETAVDIRPGSGLTRGLLRLKVQPPDAAIYLDGEFLARGEEISRLHGALPVAGGVHRLEIVRPGYESQALEIEVSGEEPKLIEIQLEKMR